MNRYNICMNLFMSLQAAATLTLRLPHLISIDRPQGPGGQVHKIHWSGEVRHIVKLKSKDLS